MLSFLSKECLQGYSGIKGYPANRYFSCDPSFTVAIAKEIVVEKGLESDIFEQSAKIGRNILHNI